MDTHERNKFSYKHFVEWIFPQIESGELSLISLQDEFEKGFNTYKHVIEQKMTSAYTSKLQHIILPKLIRQNGHKIHKYRTDIWHTWIIACWSLHHINNMQQSQSGIWYYKLDWEDNEPYGNSNAYLNSDDAVQNEVYTNQPSYDRTVDLQRITYTSDKLGTDIDI